MTPPLLLRGAEVAGRVVDVRVDGGRVVGIGHGVRPEAGDTVVDAGGGALLPGLHDHHLHLLALAAARRSVDVGPPAVVDGDGVARALAGADRLLPPGRWLRAVAYHQSVAGELDRWALDALVPGRPVRVQHRSGGLWVLSSAGLEAVGLDRGEGPPGVERDHTGQPTGRLWRLDRWLRERLPAEPVDLAPVGEDLLRRGVTGVTDATPFDDATSVALIAGAVATGALPLRVLVTGGPSLPAEAAPALERGPVKLLPPDHEPPDFDALVAAVRAARARGRAVAVHCVTAVAAAVTVAAIEAVGPHAGDRIEHGAVVPLALAERMAALGITVVTNPGFVAERGDQYLDEVEPHDQPDLWRCRSLLEVGVAVGAGTDAPFAAADPWAAMAAATTRRSPSGRAVGADRPLAPLAALDLFLADPARPGGPARAVAVGAAADLCLLAAPLADVLRDLAAAPVAMTVAQGHAHRW